LAPTTMKNAAKCDT